MVEMIRDSARLYWRREQTSGGDGGVVVAEGGEIKEGEDEARWGKWRKKAERREKEVLPVCCGLV